MLKILKGYIGTLKRYEKLRKSVGSNLPINFAYYVEQIIQVFLIEQHEDNVGKAISYHEILATSLTR